jgi:uncharacterized membrane protein YfcA
MMLAVALGTSTTIGLLTGSSTWLANAILGAVLAAYGVYGLIAARFEIRPQSERWLSPLVGLITGALSGATGVFAVPMLPYLNSLKLDKEELIQIVAIAACAATLSIALALLVSGRFNATALAGDSVLALAVAAGGMSVGQYVRRRLEPAVFRRWFFVGLLVLGGYMFFRSIAKAP